MFGAVKATDGAPAVIAAVRVRRVVRARGAVYLNEVRAVREVVLGGALTLGIASGVRAGPLEELEQVVVGSSASGRMALRYVYGGEGLVLSDDGGAHWRALCANAIRPAGSMAAPVRLGRIAIGADGTMYMTTFTGLLRDDGRGCGWRGEGPFTDQWVTDVVVHPTDPDVLFATTSNGSPDAKNGVYRRDADGSWHAVGTQDAILIGRLHVVPRGAGKLRFIERAVRGMYGTAPNFRPRFVVRVSDDMGMTWAEHEFGDAEGTVEVEAVDPTNPDRIVASLRFDSPEGGGTKKQEDQVLVSEDLGEKFTKYLRVTQFGGIDFAPDGRLWIGDRGDSFDPEAPSGLFFAPSLADAPKKVDGSLVLRCVDYRSEDDGLFVCQPYEAGLVGIDGKGYRKVFGFREAADFVACDGTPVAPLCAEHLLAAWCGASHFPQAPMCCVYPNRQGVDAGACAIAEDAGRLPWADAAPTGAHADVDAARDGAKGKGSEGGCGCRIESHASRSARSGLPAALVAFVTAWRIRRSRGRR